MQFVINLNEIRKDDILLAGGKGANLGEMFQSQFPVPNGFCVTSTSYDAFVKENNFENIIQDYLNKIYVHEGEAHKLAQQLMEILSNGKLPREIEQEIKNAYKELGRDIRVAVRSSATAEDLPEASFAGQQETYLNIKGEISLINAIKKCFASLWTDRAIIYRKKTGFDKEKVSLAVVVQMMIEGDVSGVLFTVNPSNQNRKEMMINASYGLGESIVSGIVTPDTIIWNREANKIKNKMLGNKEISIVYGNANGTIQIDNEEEKRKRFAISDKQIEGLTKVAEQIEKHYGYPQDIEWAIQDNKIYILQARGITTLTKNSSILKKTKDNKKKVKHSEVEKKILNNLIEHCPTPLYPLEFQPFQIVMNGKAKVFNELGIIMKDQVKMMNDGILSIDTSSTHISPNVLTIPFKIRTLIDYPNNMKCTEQSFKKINNRLSYIEQEKLNLYRSKYTHMVKLTSMELLNLLQEIMEMTKEIVYVRFRYNIFPSVIISKFISSKLQKIKNGMTEYDLLSNLQYKTWNMNKAINKLANVVNNNIELKKAILNLKDIDKEELENKLDYLVDSYKEFGEYYSAILKEFGWKSSNSYQAFSTVSWNEDKSNLILLLQISMSSEIQKEDKNKYNYICEEIRNKFTKRTANTMFKRIEQIRTYHVNREESLYMLERCYALSRNILREISSRYLDIFQNEKDILYLVLDEVYKLCNDSNKDYYVKQINIRKRNRMKNIMLWDNCELNDINKLGQALKGVSGNRGKVSGRVCVINEIAEFSKLKEGDILVCKYTDPSWTPLFSLANAVVSDTGGPLSHSAIVAREYDIPAVLGCGNATQVLKDGQIIIVDGDKGVVHL